VSAGRDEPHSLRLERRPYQRATSLVKSVHKPATGFPEVFEILLVYAARRTAAGDVVERSIDVR